MAGFSDFSKLLIEAYFSLLFYLPHHYASRAAPVLHKFQNASGMRPNRAQDEIPLQVITELEPAYLMSSTGGHPELLTMSGDGTPVVQDHPKEIELAWGTFVTRCIQDWIVIASVSCSFIVATPPAMQMFSDDPLTAFFVYFAVFRAVAAVGFSLIQLAFFFYNPESRTSQFAKSWLQSKNNGEFVVSAPWIILSLPAVALCWGAIGLFAALLSSVWCGRPTDAEVQQPGVGFALQLVITLLCITDFGVFIWISVVLKKAAEQARHFIRASC